MKWPIKSLIERSKRQLPNLSDITSLDQPPLHDEEVALGIYQNQGGNGVLFTSEGLRLRNNDLIRYVDILEARVPEEKTEAAHLDFLLATGKQVRVEFSGGNDRFRDAWEMLRLIDLIRIALLKDKK